MKYKEGNNNMKPWINPQNIGLFNNVAEASLYNNPYCKKGCESDLTYKLSSIIVHWIRFKLVNH